MIDTASLRAWAENPLKGTPMVPIHRDTLNAIADELDALRADKARLDSGLIMIDDRDEFGEPLRRQYVGLNLRVAIDACIDAARHEGAGEGP